jgi:hypothetical protein
MRNVIGRLSDKQYGGVKGVERMKVDRLKSDRSRCERMPEGHGYATCIIAFGFERAGKPVHGRLGGLLLS